MEQHRRKGCLAWLVNSTPLSFRTAFVQLGLWREFELCTPTHADALICRDTAHTNTQILVPTLTSLDTTGSCPTFSPHLGKSPRACPASTAWNTHPWKATEVVGGGTQCLGWWGAKMWWVGTFSMIDLEMKKKNGGGTPVGEMQRGMGVWLFLRVSRRRWFEVFGWWEMELKKD